MGLLAGEALGLDLPQGPRDKRLLTIVETDGCAADGISVATNCWVGQRTLRVEDYGKVAAAFVETRTGRAVRIVPRRETRLLARIFAPEARNRWEAYLLGYQRMPASTLLSVQAVQLKRPLEEIIGRPGKRMTCAMCGEEIINQREIIRERVIVCRACAGLGYYSPVCSCN